MNVSPVRAADGRPLDTIEIESLRIDCIVGVYPSERFEPQPLELDLALHLDTRGAASGGGLKETVDYARLTAELRFLLESGQFLLLETAADALTRYVLAPPTEDVPRRQVEAVSLRLAKPHALAGGARPALVVHRTREEAALLVEQKPFGRVDVVHVSPGCGIYRLRIAPGSAIPTHLHRVMEESEMVLGSGLLLQQRKVAPGSVFRWPRGFAHRYDNPEAIEQTVLCVDRPAFLPEDEIEVQAELEAVEGVAFYEGAES